MTTAPGRRRFTDDELLDAALRVFDQHGYQRAQVSDLATAAGTTKPTLYARLGGKEEIYLRVLEREVTLLERTLHEAYDRAVHLPLREMVELSMLAFFEYGASHRAGFGLLFGNGLAGRTESLAGRAAERAISRLTIMVSHRLRASGMPIGPSAGIIAAAGVGVALQVCDHALSENLDLEAAGALAAAYAEAAVRHIDHEVVLAVDRDLVRG